MRPGAQRLAIINCRPQAAVFLGPGSGRPVLARSAE